MGYFLQPKHILALFLSVSTRSSPRPTRHGGLAERPLSEGRGARLSDFTGGACTRDAQRALSELDCDGRARAAAATWNVRFTRKAVTRPSLTHTFSEGALCAEAFAYLPTESLY